MKSPLVRVRGVSISLVILVLVTAVTSASAQPTTGAPASPDATTTIDGRYLPPPPPPFQGVINLNATQSKPAWPARVVPPKGAPNILLILTDDVGFGAPSTSETSFRRPPWTVSRPAAYAIPTSIRPRSVRPRAQR